MKKKSIIMGAMLLFLAGVIAADILPNIDRNIQVSKERRAALKLINLTNYNVTDYIDGDFGKRCLTKTVCEPDPFEVNSTICRPVINTCSNLINSSELDMWEEEKIRNIADSTIKRNTRQAPAPTRGGTTTVTDR